MVGIDFSGGMASVLTQINSALGRHRHAASNPSGTTLQILDDGAGNTVDVNSCPPPRPSTSLAGGSGELPFFTDGNTIYTGAITAGGAQSVGFAGRITVNCRARRRSVQARRLSDRHAVRRRHAAEFHLPAAHQPARCTFRPTAGIGTAGAPFSGSITTYLRQVISQQGQAADAANNLKQGQDVVLSALQQRFNDSSGVNIDEEMANLLTLQNSYAANARVHVGGERHVRHFDEDVRTS